EEKEVGAVPYGCRREFHLPPGTYSLSVEMDWCRSFARVVEVRPGELVELEASVRWRGLFWSWTLLAAILLPGWVFVLRPLVVEGDWSPLDDQWEGLGVVASIPLTLCLACCLLAFCGVFGG